MGTGGHVFFSLGVLYYLQAPEFRRWPGQTVPTEAFCCIGVIVYLFFSPTWQTNPFISMAQMPRVCRLLCIKMSQPWLSSHQLRPPVQSRLLRPQRLPRLRPLQGLARSPSSVHPQPVASLRPKTVPSLLAAAES